MTASLSSSDGPPASDMQPVFRIENTQLLDTLGLAARKGLRYSVHEMRPKLPLLAQQMRLAQQVEPKRRTRYQQAVMELGMRLNLYSAIIQWQVPLAVPPQDDGNWRSLWDAAHTGRESNTVEPAVDSLAAILNAYVQGDGDAFNTAVAQHRDMLRAAAPPAARRANIEATFNRAELFTQASALYIALFLLACVSWMIWHQPLQRASVLLLAFTLIVHTAALCVRMYLQGRPPVTNLYSSAIFVGWGAAVFGLIIECVRRDGIGAVLAAACGFGTLTIAHFLSLDGDTMEMMRAVLDTNFWLTTHVLTIALGYSATFIAGLLGVLFIARGMFTSTLRQDDERSIGTAIYGIVCFSLLLSFIGTVLGGIWADQSWGRFWGWDTKENGALILVLWNALILHARWDRMVSHRGVAVLAVAGNIVTAWSWFGVNLLGVGLHSYGFLEGGWFWFFLFVGVNLSLILMGMLPRRVWFSYAMRDANDAG